MTAPNGTINLMKPYKLLSVRIREEKVTTEEGRKADAESGGGRGVAEGERVSVDVSSMRSLRPSALLLPTPLPHKPTYT